MSGQDPENYVSWARAEGRVKRIEWWVPALRALELCSGTACSEVPVRLFRCLSVPLLCMSRSGLASGVPQLTAQTPEDGIMAN